MCVDISNIISNMGKMLPKQWVCFLIFAFVHIRLNNGLLVVDTIMEENKRVKRELEDECPFKCKDGGVGNDNCYPAYERCDGYPYCFDGSDEENCTEVCDVDQFRCVDGEACIDRLKVCDRVDDCGDGSDERGCSIRANCSESGEFQCLNGLCIHDKLQCDGIDHCGDRSDELNCAKGKCPSDYFDCNRDGIRCIKHDLQCDGKRDCENGEDEMECGGSSQAHGGDLSYKSENLDHDDDDDDPKERDCDYPNNCHHQCTTINGMDVCGCADGYKLDDDLMTCKISGEEPLLWLSNGTKLIGYGLYSKNVKEQFEMGHTLSAIATSSNEDLLFWVNNQMDTIMMGEIDSFKGFKKSEALIRPPNVRSITSLAYDWTSRNLYWAELGDRLSPEGQGEDGLDSKIGVVAISKGKKGEVVQAPVIESPQVHLPNAIAIDPRSKNRHLYWTQHGEHAGVFRSNMDGSDVISVVTNYTGQPYSLAIDLIYDHLVWFDQSTGTIRITYLTKELTDIMMEFEHAASPVALSAFEGSVYWGNEHSFGELSSWISDEENGKLLPGLATVKSGSMVVHHPNAQPREESPCQNYHEKCDHICIPTRTNYVCRCHDGTVQRSRGVAYELGEDGKTCFMLNTKDDAFPVRNSTSFTSKVTGAPTTTTTTTTDSIKTKPNAASTTNAFNANKPTQITTIKTIDQPKLPALKSGNDADMKSTEDDLSDIYESIIKSYDQGHEAQQGSKGELEKSHASSGGQGVSMGVAWFYFTIASLAFGAIALIGVAAYKLKLSRDNRRVSIKEITPLKILIKRQAPKSHESMPSLPI